jgi:hypothetical protein
VAELLVELLHLLLAVGGGGEGDAPVGVEVVDVRERKESVEWRVDGRCDRVVAEGAERIHRDDLVFTGYTLIAVGEGEDLVEIERGEAGALDAAEIAAGALDPEDLLGLAVEGIYFVDLGAGVAAAEVGEAEIRAKKVGAVAEEFGGVEPGGNGLIPAVFEEAELASSSHRDACVVSCGFVLDGSSSAY